MEEMREKTAVAYFSKKLGSGNIVPVKELWAEVDKVPKHLKRYMTQQYGNLEQFESFLKNNSRTFFVENGMVTRYTPELENGRRNAVEYFKGILEDNEAAANYLNFRGHVGQASDDVIAFINTFYTGTSFKDFLLSRSDVFVVFDDDTVWLIEDAAVDYFKENLTGFGDVNVPVKELWAEVDKAPKHLKRYMMRECRDVEQFESILKNNPRTFFVQNGMVTLYTSELEDTRKNAEEYFKGALRNYERAPNFLNFRGHVGQASDDVVAFINTFYTGTRFKKFLQSRSDVFVVLDDDTVWFIEDEAVDYFKDILTEFGDDEVGVHYRSLRGHIGQAEKCVQEFINTQYPGDDFMDFLFDNEDVFEMLGEDVFLK